jgi:hypothetical protein
MTETTREAIANGVLPNVDAVLQVREGVAFPSGMRFVDLTPARGIALRILPDRGFDVGSAHFNGFPLAWVSKIGEVGPLAAPTDMEWGGAFGGGLVATCGLRNVGMPSEGHGLHGTFSHLSATSVSVERVLDGEGRLRATASIVDDADPGVMRVDRTITTHAGVGRMELMDVTTNLGSTATEAPILYHLNFGYPLWSGRASLAMEVERTASRDEASMPAIQAWTTPRPVSHGPEWVLEHVPVAVNGRAAARIVSPDVGIDVVVSWETDTLPLVNQWIDGNPGMNVLGIEPANCTTRGRAHERASGTMPMLEPGQERTTSIVVEARVL